MRWRRRASEEEGPPGPAGGDAVIDLREPPVEPPAAVWGSPADCPACGEHGYIDRIDLVREVMYQHCPVCWTKYEIARADTEAR